MYMVVRQDLIPEICLFSHNSSKLLIIPFLASNLVVHCRCGSCLSKYKYRYAVTEFVWIDKTSQHKIRLYFPGPEDLATLDALRVSGGGEPILAEVLGLVAEI